MNKYTLITNVYKKMAFCKCLKIKSVHKFIVKYYNYNKWIDDSVEVILKQMLINLVRVDKTLIYVSQQSLRRIDNCHK